MLQSSLTPEQAAILAATWLILLGAATMPVLVMAARFTVRFAAHETLAAIFRWVGIGVATALALAFTTPAPTAAAAEKPAAVVDSPATAHPAGVDLDAAITQAFVGVTSKAARPMPVWLLDTAVRIYTAYKVHRIGQQAEEARRIAHAALSEIAKVRAEIEAGRTLAERVQRLISTRLEAQADQLEGLARRVTAVEQKTEQLEQTMGPVAEIVTRRGCSTFHAFDRRLRRCTDRR